MARQHSIYLPAFGHRNPIPAACRVGNLVMSSIITGIDPATGKLATDLPQQCRWMFSHVRAIAEAAGASLTDIVKVNVWMADSSRRDALNEAWLAYFPDAQARPARHTQQSQLRPGLLIQCDFTALTDAAMHPAHPH